MPCATTTTEEWKPFYLRGEDGTQDRRGKYSGTLQVTQSFDEREDKSRHIQSSGAALLVRSNQRRERQAGATPTDLSNTRRAITIGDGQGSTHWWQGEERVGGRLQSARVRVGPDSADFSTLRLPSYFVSKVMSRDFLRVATQLLSLVPLFYSILLERLCHWHPPVLSYVISLETFDLLPGARHRNR